MRDARWLLLAALAACGGRHGPVDADGDGVIAELDCDDRNPAVHALVNAFVDTDGDGVGVGPPATFCTAGSPPPGYSFHAYDCAPDDPTRWREALPLVDRDGDGYTAREPGMVCYGATIPAPYLEAAKGNDCDDADLAVYRWVIIYRDQDGDGVGAPPRSIPCLGAAIPTGWVERGYDPNDFDPAVTTDAQVDELLRLIDS